MSKILRCKKCGDIIQSKHTHDMVWCKCGAVAIDGGDSYCKLTGNLEDMEFLIPERIKEQKETIKGNNSFENQVTAEMLLEKIEKKGWSIGTFNDILKLEDVASDIELKRKARVKEKIKNLLVDFICEYDLTSWSNEKVYEKFSDIIYNFGATTVSVLNKALDLMKEYAEEIIYDLNYRGGRTDDDMPSKDYFIEKAKEIIKNE